MRGDRVRQFSRDRPIVLHDSLYPPGLIDSSGWSEQESRIRFGLHLGAVRFAQIQKGAGKQTGLNLCPWPTPRDVEAGKVDLCNGQYICECKD